MDQPALLVISGPTATGKTALGAALALALGGEVVSADSMQIYRGMDIGTAKPSPAETQGVPHHMIDVAGPEETWSAARWAARADECVRDILARGRIPLVVGGTGLYIDALLKGEDFAPAGDTALRTALDAEYDAIGGEAFRQKLGAVDPRRAEKLAPADKKRLVRAMEVYLLTGETITSHDLRSAGQPPRYASVRYALTWRNRETLYGHIRRRVDGMEAAGLFAEVEALLSRGVRPSTTAMQAIGYKEAAAALRGECSREDALGAIKRASCRYAKRQLTWLRRDRALVWLYREDYPTTDALTERVLADLGP